MSAQQEIEAALRHSTDCLRIAAQLFDIFGSPDVAKYLSQQADENVSLLLPWARR